MLAPYFRFPVKNKNYVFEQVTKETEDLVVQFLNREGVKKDFFPVIESLSQFTDLNPTDFYMLKDGEEIVAAVTLNYGNFLQQTFDFLIIAFSIFLFISLIKKVSDRMKTEEPAPEPAPAPAPEPSNEEKLLAEIRDLLKKEK